MPRGTNVPHLRRLRERRALTQRELADASSLSVGVICKLEIMPAKRADMRTIRQLAAALGVSPDQLQAAP